MSKKWLLLWRGLLLLLLMKRQRLSVALLGLGRSLELALVWWFIDLRLGGSVITVWSDTVKLEADARRTWPCVCSGGIALYFPPSATLACSHH
jgi:hypothetical protein